MTGMMKVMTNACPHSGSLTDSFSGSVSAREFPKISGVVYIEDVEHARKVLKHSDVVQAGFKSEQLDGVLGSHKKPVLFMDGVEHNKMRRGTAHFFTPTKVATYDTMISKYVDSLFHELWTKKTANIDELGFRLAIKVAAEVIGLTNSVVKGMANRIEFLVSDKSESNPEANVKISRMDNNMRHAYTLAFMLFDVKPAIEARKKNPKDDLISYLISKDYSDLEILIESITYVSAGMLTTREFIGMTSYYLLNNPRLRLEYIHSTEKQRFGILHEILRLEPVVNMIYRRATEDIDLGDHKIVKGQIIGVDVMAANHDPEVVGKDSEELCPFRSLPKGIQPPVMSFGDGAHRCPGAYLAIKETDMFLKRFFIWGDLRMVGKPEIEFNENLKSYEVRNLNVRVG